MERRLTAILAADVVGYSSLMEKDEAGTYARLRAGRKELFEPEIHRHHGRIFKLMGDGMMAEFGSIVDAVECAVALQRGLAQRNSSLPDAERIEVRIGVNLGDVIEEHGSAFGDAVNIAARLQALAKPGGVLISGSVYDQVRNKLSARFIGAGTRHVKNVAKPIRTFEVLPAEPPGIAGRLSAVLARVVSRPVRVAATAIAALGAGVLAFNWLVQLWQAREAATPGEASLATTELPARSVAVLAFENRGGSEGTEILAEGIPETVMHQLSLMKGLTVIARHSSFAFKGRDEDMRVIGRKLNVRYLLEGSVQTAGDLLRVTSSLVDAQTGISVWSKQFNPTLQNVFAVQDEIALEVARAMQLTVETASGAADSVRRGVSENYEAYFEFLRGRALLASVRVTDVPAAIDALNAAIQHDPQFALAYVLLARAKVVQAEQITTDDRMKKFPQALENAMGLLDEAIELDPQSGEAYVERGFLNLYFDVAAADTDLRRGLKLAPNYARGYEGLAAVLFQSVARRRESLEMIEKARQLDPLDPRLDVIKATYLEFGTGDFEQAATLMKAVLERDPLYVPALVRLADIRWAGQAADAEAVALAERAVALDPENEPAWRQLAAGYLGVGEPAAAEEAFRHTTDHPAYGRLWLRLYQKEWRRAGEAAYTLIDAGPTYGQIESLISIAIRRHARVTGDYRRAIATLEDWASVTWDGKEPLLQGQLDTGWGVAALADMLMATGQHERARVLLEELIADSDLQIERYGRGEMWRIGSRAIALALLGRPEEAIAALERQVQLGFNSHSWRVLLEDDPAFDAIRERKEFQALLANHHAKRAAEREKYLRLRAKGAPPQRP